MIPIRDSVPKQGRAIATLGLILLNIAVFLLELKLQIDGELNDFLQLWGVIPARLREMAAEILSGTWLALPFFLGTVLLSVLLHGSFAQILGNLLYLWVFGRTLEGVLGLGRFLGIYWFSGVLTYLLLVGINPDLEVMVLGGNGAIAAILGAYLIYFPKAQIESILPLIVVFIPAQLPALFYGLWWFVQQLTYSIGTLNIAGMVNSWVAMSWVSLAGLLLGGLLGYLCKSVDRRARSNSPGSG
jgi:membrane associated rhomboid family serine protease